MSDLDTPPIIAAASHARGVGGPRAGGPGPLPDDDLRRITVPTLLILGADSALYDHEQVAARARGLLGDVHVETITDAGLGIASNTPTTTRPASFTSSDPARNTARRVAARHE